MWSRGILGDLTHSLSYPVLFIVYSLVLFCYLLLIWLLTHLLLDMNVLLCMLLCLFHCQSQLAYWSSVFLSCNLQTLYLLHTCIIYCIMSVVVHALFVSSFGCYIGITLSLYMFCKLLNGWTGTDETIIVAVHNLSMCMKGDNPGLN